MGANAVTMEEFWLKHGHPDLLDSKSMFCFFFWMKHTPPSGSGAFMLRMAAELARVRDFLNHVVQEIRWSNWYSRFNHCPHFPYFMTHFTDSMPISSIGGMWSMDLRNPRYAAHIFKDTVAVDMLGNIVCICPLALGTSAY